VAGDEQRGQEADQLLQRVHLDPMCALEVLVARHGRRLQAALLPGHAGQEAEGEELQGGEGGDEVDGVHGLVPGGGMDAERCSGGRR